MKRTVKEGAYDVLHLSVPSRLYLSDFNRVQWDLDHNPPKTVAGNLERRRQTPRAQRRQPQPQRPASGISNAALPMANRRSERIRREKPSSSTRSPAASHAPSGGYLYTHEAVSNVGVFICVSWRVADDHCGQCSYRVLTCFSSSISWRVTHTQSAMFPKPLSS